MKVYTYSEARQRLAEVLNIARNEEVVIKRRGGEIFSIIFRKSKRSPFDVPGIQTKATTKDILAAVRESRERFAEAFKIDGQEQAAFSHINPSNSLIFLLLSP